MPVFSPISNRFAQWRPGSTYYRLLLSFFIGALLIWQFTASNQVVDFLLPRASLAILPAAILINELIGSKKSSLSNNLVTLFIIFLSFFLTGFVIRNPGQVIVLSMLPVLVVLIVFQSVRRLFLFGYYLALLVLFWLAYSVFNLQAVTYFLITFGFILLAVSIHIFRGGIEKYPPEDWPDMHVMLNRSNNKVLFMNRSARFFYEIGRAHV